MRLKPPLGPIYVLKRCHRCRETPWNWKLSDSIPVQKDCLLKAEIVRQASTTTLRGGPLSRWWPPRLEGWAGYKLREILLRQKRTNKMEDESALYAMLSSNAYDVVDIYSAWRQGKWTKGWDCQQVAWYSSSTNTLHVEKMNCIAPTTAACCSATLCSATVLTDMTPLINIIMHKVRVEEATQGRAANEWPRIRPRHLHLPLHLRHLPLPFFYYYYYYYLCIIIHPNEIIWWCATGCIS